MGISGPMLPRGHAEEFEPFIGTGAVGMHGAMNHHGGQALLMWFENALQPRLILYVGKAFIMDDDVVAAGPAGVLIRRDFGISGSSALLHHRDFDVGALRKAFGNDLLLRVIVVTTAAAD